MFTQSEPELQAELIEALNKDFILFAGAGKGRGVLGWPILNPDEKVYIDLVVKARQPLIDIGFINKPFGIEVKAPDTGRKVFDMGFQLLSYRLSRFELRNGPEELAFILSYPRLKLFDEKDGLILERFLTRWRIGWCELTKYGWEISASAGQYYARRGYNDELKMTSQKNYPLITQRHGNYKGSKHRVSHGNGA